MSQNNVNNSHNYIEKDPPGIKRERSNDLQGSKALNRQESYITETHRGSELMQSLSTSEIKQSKELQNPKIPNINLKTHKNRDLENEPK